MPSNIFLDCGAYHGQSIEKYFYDKAIDESWEIYAFEPRSELDILPRIEDLKLPIKLIRKAVWLSDGEVVFDTSSHDNAGYVLDSRGGDVKPDSRTVETIDFSKFVRELPEDAYIICSMDIEGAEFPLLRKMLEDHTVDRFKILDVEFHHRMVPDLYPDDARSLIKQIGTRGVEVRLKEALE